MQKALVTVPWLGWSIADRTSLQTSLDFLTTLARMRLRDEYRQPKNADGRPRRGRPTRQDGAFYHFIRSVRNTYPRHMAPSQADLADTISLLLGFIDAEADAGDLRGKIARALRYQVPALPRAAAGA
jgi:hypothetical protein